MTRRQMKFFEKAQKESESGAYKNFKIGAVVTYNGSVIGIGHNSCKTSPVQEEYNKYRNFEQSPKNNSYIHAEIDALAPLRKKDIDWKKVSVYTCRTLKGGKLACARPCPACMAFIKSLGIKNIYFTDEDGDYVKETILK